MRWDEMKDEYLAYRARLVKEIVSYEDEMAAHAATKRRRSPLPSPAKSSVPDRVETDTDIFIAIPTKLPCFRPKSPLRN